MTEFTPKVSYTDRDFVSVVEELRKFILETRPDVQSDFFDSTLGRMLIDMLGMVTDKLSYGQDVIGQEMFLATCRRYESALRVARSVGYVPRSAVPAEVTVRSIVFPDQLVLNGGTIPAGSILKGQNGLPYELLEDYVIAAGETVARLSLFEGVSYSEEFVVSTQKNQEIVGSNGVVADESWELFVGDPNTPANKWTEVENVNFEQGATQTYDTYFDGLGRVHIRFGDGSAGKIPDQIVTLKYRTTSGKAGNAPVGAIRGSLKANLASPATGTVSVEFENKDTDQSVSEGTQLQNGEAQGATVSSATQTGTLLNIPIVAGSVVLTFALPGGSGTIVCQDNGAGVFQVVSNTSVFTLLTSALTYSTGGWSLTFSGILPAAGPITATYYSIEEGDIFSIGVIGAASGGDDRETIDELKRNIPAYIRSQDKILTIQDYNDVLRRLPGISLVFTDLWLSSYTANAVKVHVWTDEEHEFQSEDSAGTKTGTPVIYTRYATVQRDKVNEVQAYLKARTILTVHNIIFRPEMLWADVYLGNVTYDKRLSAADVRDAITAAVVKVFEDSTGFIVHLSEIYNAVRDATGVKNFIMSRVATGTQETSLELQGVTPALATISGTLLKPVVTPKTVYLTVEQTSSSQIVLRDNGAGQFVLDSGTAVVVSSSIDYNTGAWTVTLGAALIPNQQILASYANVTEDYRHQQNTLFDAGGTLADLYPPPGVPTSTPPTPPYKDGKPESATRAGVPAVLPYVAGDLLTYPTLQDITIDAVISLSHFYDETYQYNNEIYYDSFEDLTTDIRAINLRRLVFDLIPG